MNRAPIPLAALSISPSSRRAIEAGLAAGTSGPAFWALHAFAFCFVSGLAIVAWAAAGWACLATLTARELGMEALGIPFFGFFAMLATLVWSAEVRFLRLALHAARQGEG